MSAEIRLAFDHPEARSEATATETPLDRISLRDYRVAADIGAFQQERGTAQTLCFNVVVEVGPVAAPLADDVDRILSYDRIIEAIDAALDAERLNLLETLAERVADRVLRAPQARRVFVRVEKLDRGPFALGVEIVRSAAPPRAPLEGSADAAAPHPRVVFLTNAAISDPALPRLIDRLTATDGAAAAPPVILCVGLPDGDRPSAAHGMPQRRIDLLAMEQNAWKLAGRDDRCVVVATRTELDWAMRQRQATVWAPSKMILDAGPHGPHVGPSDPLALSLWFATEMKAAEFVTVGMEAPSSSSSSSSSSLSAVPIRAVALDDL